MTAGVPGTGIGGLFYVTAALVLPLRGVVLKMRGVRVSWPTILRQLRLAIGVFAGIWAMGWLIGFMFGPVGTTQATGKLDIPAHQHYQNVLRWAALFAGFATLAVVLLSVQLARLITRMRVKWRAK
jgi:hypothetical protein